MKLFKNSFLKRKLRNRWHLKKKNPGKLRLSVYRSGQHIEAQIIDDVKSITVASASSRAKEFAAKGYNIEGAALVGTQIAEAAKKAKITEVYFDRGAYPYHGRIAALADAARKAGLKF